MASNKELKALITLAGRIDPSLQRTMIQANKQIAQTAKSSTLMGKAGNAAFKLFKSGAKAAAVGLAALALAGTVALGSLAAKGWEASTALTEVQNVVDVTFGSSAGIIDEWSKQTLDAYGLSELSAKRYSSTMGAMLKSQGVAADDLLVMSQSLTMLTGDMASFRDLKPDEMFEKIRSGISGETEPLKQLGINMSVANMEAFALAQGITTSFDEMDEASKAILRYNYLLETTKDAHGDFGDTALTASNQQRLLGENLMDVAGKVMKSAEPAIAQMLLQMNDFIKSIDVDKAGAFVAQMADLGAQLLPIAMDILPVIGSIIEAIWPTLMELAEIALPIIAELVGVLLESIRPLLPLLIDIAKLVLPPIAEILKIVIKVAGMALEGVLTLLRGLLGGNAAPRESTGATATTAPSGWRGYANGGFADEPSIFGEAGLEAAIPIRPGNRRSLSLLERTNQLMGVGSSNQVSLIYSPTIQGSSSEDIKPLLKRHSEELEAMVEDIVYSRGRLAYGAGR